PSSFVITGNNVYQFVIEPLLTISYALLLICIERSHNRELATAYYIFFIAVGIAGISNVIVILPFSLNNRYVRLGDRSEYPMCLFEYLSHVFGTAHTFGKLGTILTRVTGIVFDKD
ncbi:hypothetical protein PENTCL1PPCAC_26737, partial [Pristionchus entomophagus]